MLVLAAVWLLVIGYGLVFIGYSYFHDGSKVSFQTAFFPSGLIKPATAGPTTAGLSQNLQSSNPIQGRSSGSQVITS